MKSFTIIGGGATGTLLAVNLINQAGEQPLVINLIEHKSRIGRGVAYSSETDAHRLNVPAGKMGAFPYDVEHFYKWLTEKKYDFKASDFVPRRIYGEYLQTVFDEAVNGKKENVVVKLFHDEAVDVSFDNGKTEILLKSGDKILSDKLILAFGNFLPPHLKTAEDKYITARKYFQNPWDTTIAEKIAATDEVLIIGTGLTAVDSILSLSEKPHAGKIFSISTHGWFPAVHQLGYTYPDFSAEVTGETSVRRLSKIIRSHVRNAEKKGSNWRAVIDALRPATQQLWQNLPENEKRRFMRRARRIWDVSRHRIPAECAEVLDRMQNENHLINLKGRIINIRQLENDKFEVIYLSKNQENSLTVDAIINCTGSESNFSKIDMPLIKNLLHKGYLKTDALALGLDAQPNGKISENLYTIGTALKGILWESTAMPEIRQQAHQLALELLS